MLKRAIQTRIEESFFKGKAVLIYGARQVGKTTLIREIERSRSELSLFLNCDEPDVRANLTDATSTNLAAILGDKRLLFIDEAQRVPNIGLTMKLLVDNFPDRQVVATGSSSLELAGDLSEPLTGRKFEFQLYPFTLTELQQIHSPAELRRLLPVWMTWGMYPEIVTTRDDRQTLLRELASSYLYKDVLQFQEVRKPELLDKLLTALALQIGQEVSYTELAGTLGVRKETIASYVQLLEQAFVIFRLGPFSRNLRTELKRLRKVYFLDLGIRNALIRNYNPPELRNDTGMQWENFLISERFKQNRYSGKYPGGWFWRTHQQQEIDYLEEDSGQLAAYEFKWNTTGKWKAPATFTRTYPEARLELINPSNFLPFVGIR